MKYRITHITRYTYSKPVSYCYNLAHLLPRDFHRQSCSRTTLTVEPVATRMQSRRDFFGNNLSYFSVESPHQELVVTAVSEVEIKPHGGLLDAACSMACDEIQPYLLSSTRPEDLDARQYLLEAPFISVDADLYDYAGNVITPGRPIMEAVHDLMGRIHANFKYDPHFSTIATPLLDVFKHRRGVCQDFAHLAIACLISHGIPARYVSGYLETLPPPGKQKLRGADASHAWFSVYVPNHGWMDFDPTNNQVPMYRHITTAWGRDYSDVTPLKGVIFGGGNKHKLDVSVDVEALDGAAGLGN
jgi:transglutaminase-like putative cysteine protease